MGIMRREGWGTPRWAGLLRTGRRRGPAAGHQRDHMATAATRAAAESRPRGPPAGRRDETNSHSLPRTVPLERARRWAVVWLEGHCSGRCDATHDVCLCGRRGGEGEGGEGPVSSSRGHPHPQHPSGAGMWGGESVTYAPCGRTGDAPRGTRGPHPLPDCVLNVWAPNAWSKAGSGRTLRPRAGGGNSLKFSLVRCDPCAQLFLHTSEDWVSSFETK